MRLPIESDYKDIRKIARKLAPVKYREHVRRGFLLGDLRDKKLFLEDVLVPEQESCNFTTLISPEQFRRALTGIEKKRVVGLVTYVPNLGWRKETDLAKRLRKELRKTYNFYRFIGLFVDKDIFSDFVDQYGFRRAESSFKYFKSEHR